MKLYFRLLRYLPPYRTALVTALVSMFAFALSSGAMAYLLGPAIKFIFSGNTGEPIQLIPFGIFTVSKDSMSLAIPLAIIVVAIVKGLSFYGNSYYMDYVGQRVVADLRQNLYEHILRLPIKYFGANSTGTLMSRLTNDVSMLQNSTTNAIAVALRQLLTLIALAAVIISMDWRLSVIALVAYPLAVLPMIKFGKKIKSVATEGQVTIADMTSLLHESIKGIRIVKAFGMEEYEVRRFEEKNVLFARFNLKNIMVRAVSSPIVEIIGAIAFAATIWYAAHRIGNGSLKPENFISFFAAVMMLYQPVKALNGVHLNIQEGLAAAHRVFAVLDTPTEIDCLGAKRGAELTGPIRSIEFKAVSFGYGDKPVLNGIDLRVEKNEVVAIVGTSGAGKTTLVNLIPRFYDVTGGGIFFNGVNAKELRLSSLRGAIAIVSQQVVLFNDTIRGNIAYGDPGRSDKEVEEAAKAANADLFIGRLPNGYDTVVGESGLRLSGGEKQKIAIARALLKNAPILILDEATSSLDSESEHEVQKALSNLIRGRTTFVIAHRLSTVRNADRIIVLGKGARGATIVEEGRHEELLAQNGEYARLHKIQFNT